MTVNYDLLTEQYKAYRRPDPRIAQALWAHLAGARYVLNVGAGIGSYEPKHCKVVALEPSEEMIALRPASTATVVNGHAEELPFRDCAFDAAMAILTIHHWPDIRKGLSEMLRVTRARVVLLTWVGYGNDFWLADYIPEIRGVDSRLFPTLGELDEMLGHTTVEVVELPHDCTDGFMCAYWRRPEAYLDSGVRKAISTFERIGNVADELAALKRDLDSGAWEQNYGDLLDARSMDLGYRIVVSDRRTPDRRGEPVQ
ncbi:class I SAM-dependent methyltransferase [Thermodesulfobacteriota bacterium]